MNAKNQTTLTAEDVAALRFIREARANRLAGYGARTGNARSAVVLQVCAEQRAMCRTDAAR